jgi:hypothetical protein
LFSNKGVKVKNVMVFMFCAVIFLVGCSTADKNVAITDPDTVEVIPDNASENKTRSYRESIDRFNHVPDDVRNFEPPELIEKK